MDTKNISCWIGFVDGAMKICDQASKYGILLSKFNPPVLSPDDISYRFLLYDHVLDIEYKKKLKSDTLDINLANTDGQFSMVFGRDEYEVVDENHIFDTANFLVTDTEPSINTLLSS